MHVGNVFQVANVDVVRTSSRVHGPAVTTTTRASIGPSARLDADAVLVIADALTRHALAHLADRSRAQRLQYRVGREHT